MASANGKMADKKKSQPLQAQLGKPTPKLHFLGMKRSGKSSIVRTVFHRENASDTLHLESTKEVIREPKHSIIDFEVWDHPAKVEDSGTPFLREILSSPASLIWVIDAQDEYYEVPAHLASTLQAFAHAANPAGPKTDLRLPSHVTIEVFMHKTDCVSTDFRAEISRDIQSRVNEELDAWGLEGARAACSFHQTSIFDRSIFEALSRVVQKHIKPHYHASVEALVSSLYTNCRLEKAYLMDTQYMFYIASDTRPGDLKDFETLSDYLEVVRDVNKVYSWRGREEGAEELYDEHHIESMLIMEKRGAKSLYVKSMNKFLTLACILGGDLSTDKQVLIEYNVGVFQKGLNEVLDRLRSR